MFFFFNFIYLFIFVFVFCFFESMLLFWNLSVPTPIDTILYCLIAVLEIMYLIRLLHQYGKHVHRH